MVTVMRCRIERRKNTFRLHPTPTNAPPLPRSPTPLHHFPGSHPGNVHPHLPPLATHWTANTAYSARALVLPKDLCIRFVEPFKVEKTRSTRCLPQDTCWTPPAARHHHLCGFSTPQSAPPTPQAPPGPQSMKHSFTTYPPPRPSPLRRQRARLSFLPLHPTTLGALRTGGQRVEERAHIHVPPLLRGPKSI
jgi:hypothetical protein